MSFRLCKAGVVHQRTAVRADSKDVLRARPRQVAGTAERAPRRLAETFTAETSTAELDSLIKDAVKEGTTIDGADGLRNELTKAMLERALNSELTHYLRV